MNHVKHSYLMIGLLAVGAALYFSGILGGGSLFLLWFLGCMAMMAFMMWVMMRTPGGTENANVDADQTTRSTGSKDPSRPA